MHELNVHLFLVTEVGAQRLGSREQDERTRWVTQDRLAFDPLSHGLIDVRIKRARQQRPQHGARVFRGLHPSRQNAHREVEERRVQRLALKMLLLKTRQADASPFTAHVLSQVGDLLGLNSVSYTHLRAHETDSYLVC